MTIITVASGITSDGLAIGAGTELIVLSGGTAIHTSIASGGFAVVSSGGVVFDATIAAGGMLSGAGNLGDEIPVSSAVRPSSPMAVRFLPPAARRSV
jgi:autotransporter passenger strand-loop-strand repeat protein